AGHHGRKFPAQLSYDIGIWIVFNRRDKGWERHVLAEFLFSVCVDDQVARQPEVIGGKNVHDGRVRLQELASARSPIENPGVKTRAGTIDRIAARRPKCDWHVSFDM